MSGPVTDGVVLVSNGSWPGGTTPHKIAGQTLLDGQPVRRRVEVRKRRPNPVTGDRPYVVSTCTQDDGLFEFRHLPVQQLSDPYVVTCFDDSPTGYGNALVFDHVYQVDDAGNPPQT